MWQATVSRRELLEAVLSSKKPVGIHFEKAILLDADYPLNRDVLMIWSEEPSPRSVLPSLVVVGDNERDAIFAQINSNSGGPSPFTAFCRVLSESEARLFSRVRQSDGDSTVIEGLVGVAFCEAMIHAGGALHPADLSPAICKRTVAFAWAKAVSNGVPVESLELLIDNWFEALHVCNGAERIPGMKLVVASEISIFMVATSLYFGMPLNDPVGQLCEALIQNDDLAMQKQWRILSSRLSASISLREIEESSREERGSYLQLALNTLTESDDWMSAALCGFLATRVSPGSFEHLEFLLQRGGPRVALWYSFFAALQRPRGVLGFSGGLGSRVVRDISRTESIYERPTADVSLAELRVLARGGMESIARRLSHSNEIEIEILPLLNCSFRFNAKQVKQHDLFEKNGSDQGLMPQPELDSLSPIDQINFIIRSLEKLGKNIPDIRENHFKTTPRRTRKSTK